MYYIECIIAFDRIELVNLSLYQDQSKIYVNLDTVRVNLEPLRTLKGL